MSRPGEIAKALGLKLKGYHDVCNTEPFPASPKLARTHSTFWSAQSARERGETVILSERKNNFTGQGGLEKILSFFFFLREFLTWAGWASSKKYLTPPNWTTKKRCPAKIRAHVSVLLVHRKTAIYMLAKSIRRITARV